MDNSRFQLTAIRTQIDEIVDVPGNFRDQRSTAARYRALADRETALLRSVNRAVSARV